MAIGQPLEVANEIGAPISASDYTHNDWFFHITAIDGSKIFLAACSLGLSILIILLNAVFGPCVHRYAAALGRFPFIPEKPLFLAALTCSKVKKGRPKMPTG
jgi:hypothetical protein